jgi:hypothetical protein
LSTQFFLLLSEVVESDMVESLTIVESFMVESGVAAAVLESGVVFAVSAVAALGVGAPAAGSGLEQPASRAPRASAAAREVVRMLISWRGGGEPDG